MSRGRNRLPRHIPPMNVPRSTPIETADEPITSWRSWNQTTSYISAAQPLPTNSSSSAGRYRRGVINRPFLASSVQGKSGMVSHGLRPEPGPRLRISLFSPNDLRPFHVQSAGRDDGLVEPEQDRARGDGGRRRDAAPDP